MGLTQEFDTANKNNPFCIFGLMLRADFLKKKYDKTW